MRYDVAIVGGSFAGLSAAVQLARARRSVLVIDEGLPRNRFAAHSHGFLGQDGRPPAAILEDARSQLLAYPTATVLNGRALTCAGAIDGFRVELADGASLSASRLILSTGVRDELPAIPGLSERWGRTVLHCPYCHGYEAGPGPFGVLASGPEAAMKARLVADWGPVILFTNGVAFPDGSKPDATGRHAIDLEHGHPVAIEDASDGTIAVFLDSGRRVALSALFVPPKGHLPELVTALGCATTDGPLGSYLKVDARQESSVPGIYAAGDVARMVPTVAAAVYEGAMAGAMAHQSLVFQAMAA